MVSRVAIDLLKERHLVWQLKYNHICFYTLPSNEIKYLFAVKFSCISMHHTWQSPDIEGAVHLTNMCELVLLAVHSDREIHCITFMETYFCLQNLDPLSQNRAVHRQTQQQFSCNVEIKYPLISRFLLLICFAYY